MPASRSPSTGNLARLVVADDGRGMAKGARQQGLDEGHIGLHSQTLRVEAAGGSLTVAGEASGTVATVLVPVKPLPGTAQTASEATASSEHGPRSGRAGGR